MHNDFDFLDLEFELGPEFPAEFGEPDLEFDTEFDLEFDFDLGIVLVKGPTRSRL